jgi:all-trans-retinol 13,14-reductase
MFATMSRYDIVIIGSGLGGLVCGYILSKHGYNVAVLEKNAQIGGCLQTFRRFGVKFDTGMHYIGSMEEGQILHRLFNYFDLIKDVKVSRLDPEGYDIISMAGRKYRYASGYERFVDTLSESFPDRRSDIENYVRGIRNIAEASPLYNMRKINTNTFIEPDYVKKSINEFIDSKTSDPILANVLAGNQPLYAGVKDKTPIYIHALINNFYIQSAWRIVGGGDCIAASLANSIRSAGGAVFTNCKVVNIKCDDSKAVGVELEDGTIVEADSFICNTHPHTMLSMVEETPLIRKAYRERIGSLDNTIANFTVYIKFKDNTVPYLNSNFYYYDKPDIWDSINYDSSHYPESYLFMHQCHKENPIFAQSAEMIGYMHYSEVAKWENTYVGHRGEDYKEFKQFKAGQMIAELEESFPGISSSIESYETSSPLTYRDYTGTFHGSMYGVVRDKNFPIQTLVSQRTKIPNLFMTGQNINSHGILGVSIGSAITCAEFLGLNTIINEIDKA